MLLCLGGIMQHSRRFCQFAYTFFFYFSVVAPGQKAYKKIREKFGDEVFHADGQLDRDKIGQIIFHEEDKRKLLNEIVHPAIQKQLLWQIFVCFLRGHKFVVLDIPLLFETKRLLPYISYTVVVFCHEEQQLNRLMERNSLSMDDAKARIKTQIPLPEKCKLATYVIDNSGSIEEAGEQVKAVYVKIQASSKHLFCRIGLLILIAAVVCGIISFF
uniref:Dephospho-CoA kinase domain-containing protein n=1 Tax=Arion vulgaris TaxID=1028688 RepID=A0A0B6Y9W5_9EUPU